MEQVIQAALKEKEIRSQIENEYKVRTLCKEEIVKTKGLWKEAFPEYTDNALDFYFENRAEDGIMFAVENEEIISMLNLYPYSAAVRRNPPLPGKNRIPCMADVVRVDTNYMAGFATKQEYQRHGYGQRVMEGALRYQYNMNVPFMLVSSDKNSDEILKKMGFHYIYDRFQYELDHDLISEEMLGRAESGEVVKLSPSNITLSVVNKEKLLTLAHFVNANLCKKYGLFMIRSAVYYERLQREVISRGGNIFIIMENDKIIGYFSLTRDNTEELHEVVFERQSDIDRYIYTSKERKPSVMARIVNLSEMLKLIASQGKVTIAVRIYDEMIAQNNGLFIWYLDEHGSYMERIEEDEKVKSYQMRPELTVTIGELTAFFFEYIKLKENLKFDSIYLTGPAWVNENII